jgi:hypothetical protein
MAYDQNPTLHPPADIAPVRPLGFDSGALFLLDGAGQFRRITAKDAEAGRGVYDLFAGGLGGDGMLAEEWLEKFFPPRRERQGGAAWSSVDAGAWLIKACKAASIFDATIELRRLGVWREGPAAVAHAGLALIDAEGSVSPAGCMRAGAVYPTSSPGAFRDMLDPLPEAVSAADMLDLFDEVRRGWGWRRADIDAVAWFGWVAQAALGAFPRWRSHLWVQGQKGSGKSQLIQLGHELLGPLSPQVYSDYSPAGVRQAANGQARAHLFDEAEATGGAGRVEGVIEMARTMSGGEGSLTIRGGSDHTSVAFALHGAVYLASIIPGRLEPQDRSRFVMLELGGRPRATDPAAAEEALLALHERAAELGRGFWRRMLARSVDWDRAHKLASAYVQRLGGEARDGQTIGAVLAGWHLATSDAPMTWDDLEEINDVALALLDDSKAAQEEGEGERCWSHLMNSEVNFGGGEKRRVGDVVWSARGGDASEASRKRLSRFAMRLAPGESIDGSEDRLWIVSGVNKALDELFRSTRWAGGGHRAALLMLDGVKPEPAPKRVGGMPARVLAIPRKYWPDYRAEDGGDSDE